jgi:hypothetical protein
MCFICASECVGFFNSTEYFEIFPSCSIYQELSPLYSYVSLFIHLPLDRYLGYFQFMLLQTKQLWTLYTSLYSFAFRYRMVGSYGRCAFNFLRNCQADLYITLFHILLWKWVFQPLHILCCLQLRESIDKWDFVKLKTFCTTKEMFSKLKRPPTK